MRAGRRGAGNAAAGIVPKLVACGADGVVGDGGVWVSDGDGGAGVSAGVGGSGGVSGTRCSIASSRLACCSTARNARKLARASTSMLRDGLSNGPFSMMNTVGRIAPLSAVPES